MLSERNGIKLKIKKQITKTNIQILKYLEIKQYILKITYGSKKKKSQEKPENILKEMKVKIHHIKICAMQLKQYLMENT